MRLQSLPCHIQPVSLTLSRPQLLLLCPRGTNAHRADCRRGECQVVLHKLVQRHVHVRYCPRAGLGWVTAHNHAVMWILLTHVVDEDTEWREGVPCHLARRGRAGDHVALSGAAACVCPLPPPVSSSEDSWLLSSWREGLIVRVPGGAIPWRPPVPMEPCSTSQGPLNRGLPPGAGPAQGGIGTRS